jgi:hypothetical protein
MLVSTLSGVVSEGGIAGAGWALARRGRASAAQIPNATGERFLNFIVRLLQAWADGPPVSLTRRASLKFKKLREGYHRGVEEKVEKKEVGADDRT